MILILSYLKGQCNAIFYLCFIQQIASSGSLQRFFRIFLEFFNSAVYLALWSHQKMFQNMQCCGSEIIFSDPDSVI